MTVERDYPKCSENTVVGKRMWFPLFITMLMGALYILHVPNAVRFVVGGLFLAVLLLVREETSFYLLMFVLCVNEMLNFGATSLTMIFVALYTAKSLLAMKIKYQLYWPVVLSTAALVAYSVLTTALGIGEQLLNTVKMVFFLYYTAVLLMKNRHNREILYTNAFRYVAMGINFFGIMAVLVNGLPSLSQRFTISADVSINFLAVVSAIAIVNLLYVVIVRKSDYTTLDLILIVGCCFWGVLTQSRTFILAVMIGVVLIFFFASSLKQKGKILFGVFLAALAFAILTYITPAIKDRVLVALDRIINPRNDDVSNGRYMIWGQTISAMVNQGYSLLGVGDYTLLNVVYLDKIEVAHNVFIETWVIYGYLGCALLIMAFSSFIRHYVFDQPKTKLTIVSLSPLLVITCALFFSHHFIGRSFSMVFILSWLPLTFGESRSAMKRG